MADNPDTPIADNAETPDVETSETPSTWKSQVNTDLRNSPLLQKFEDTPEGLSKVLESYGNLEQLLGHEKVPIPKDANDVEGWNRFSKAMGIPDKAEGYGLSDVNIPESMKAMTFDKNKFAEVVHAYKLTPAQANGLWKDYTRMSIEAYGKAMEGHQKTLTESVNQLKSEWGDAYQTNVELGQMVINKFTPDKDTNDYITALLVSDPKGVKFLAQIGEQFAENKVGDFSYKRFSLSPEQAQDEIDSMSKDLDGAYMNTKNKFTPKEHQVAVDRVNHLRESIQRSRE